MIKGFFFTLIIFISVSSSASELMPLKNFNILKGTIPQKNITDEDMKIIGLRCIALTVAIKDSDFEPKIEKEKQVKKFFSLSQEVGLEFGLKAFLAAETAESKENNLSIPYVDILEKKIPKLSTEYLKAINYKNEKESK